MKLSLSSGLLLLVAVAVAPASGQVVPDAPVVPSKPFIALHSLYLGVAMADTSYTAYDINHHIAEECNPLAPQNNTLRALEAGATWAAITEFDKHLYKHGHKWWWVGPSIAIGAHSWGLYTGIHPLGGPLPPRTPPRSRL